MTSRHVRRYALLLRAVNLGAHKRVSMPAWRAQLEALGCTDVATYVQSGNATVTSPLSAPALQAEVRAQLAKEQSVDTDVFVRTGAELARVVAGNPFPEVAATPKLLHVAFVDGTPAALEEAKYAPDRFAVGEGVVYLHFAEGSGRSKLAVDGVRKLGVPATARNWTTVLALTEATGD